MAITPARATWTRLAAKELGFIVVPPERSTGSSELRTRMCFASCGASVLPANGAEHLPEALDFGAQEFVDLESDALEDVGGVDLVFDVLGGDIQKRSASLIRPGGTLVTVVGPPEARPVDGLAVDFVVESDRAQLTEIVDRVR